MTEKQFEIFPQNVTKDGSLIIIQKGLKLYNIQEIVDLLNENEQLKQQLFYDGDDVLNELATKCSKLQKENEQFKKQLKELRE